MIRLMLTGVAALALAACSQEPAGQTGAPAAQSAETAPDSGQRLDAALAAQPDDVKARYAWRHPKETLQFFGVEPGMTVVEALPGGGWYSKILLPYLGEKGALIGADYALEMWPLLGEAFSFPAAFLESRKTWTTDWTIQAGDWCEGDCASVAAFQFGALPGEMAGGADVVLFIRALHNINRFDERGGFLSQAIDDAKTVLKPGGIVGVVQHRAQEDMPDDWAQGAAGYLKQSALVAAFEAAGFEYLGASEVNANPNDRPTTEDVVWRLPPALGTSRDNPDLRAQFEAIGESDRMTLKFRKPN